MPVHRSTLARPLVAVAPVELRRRALGKARADEPGGVALAPVEIALLEVELSPQVRDEGLAVLRPRRVLAAAGWDAGPTCRCVR